MLDSRCVRPYECSWPFQLVAPAIEPPGSAKTDFDIIKLVSGALGHEIPLETPADAMDEIAARVRPAGVMIVESRLTRLSYAPEIAQAMLRQQQASAVVGARTRIVEGAVGMVQLALRRLQEEDVVELDEERKAAMVSNLLVVLCSEAKASPVINAGSLYA